MARDIQYRLHDIARSDVLAYLAGMEKLHPDIAYPTVLPFRVTTLSSTTATVSDEEQVPANFDFYCDGITASVESIVADTRDISRFVYVNVRGEGLNREVFSTAPSMAFFQHALGGTGGAAAVMPTFTPTGMGLREFKVPYVFQAGQLVRATFSCDAALGATAHIAEAWLTGYMVRNDLKIVEKPAPEVTFSKQAIDVIAGVLKALRG